MNEERTNSLKEAISKLNSSEVGEALKNLKVTLEQCWEHQVDDDEIRTTLPMLQLDGAASELRDKLAGDEADKESLEKFGKALLAYLASDETLFPYVEEAVTDATDASTQLVFESLLVLSGVVILLKWRPKSVKWNKKEGLEIIWDENDVSVVSDLAKAASSMPGK